MRATLRSAVFLVALAVTLLPRPAPARPVDPQAQIPRTEAAGGGILTGRVIGAGSLSAFGLRDTVTYGGTVWAPDSARWEAIRDGVWTFDSGVGSAFGPTGPNKPAGYHTLMEGWYGIDLTVRNTPWFRRSQTCVINGSWSFWAGLTQAETDPFC